MSNKRLNKLVSEVRGSLITGQVICNYNDDITMEAVFQFYFTSHVTLNMLF